MVFKHQTIASQHNAGIGQEYFDFQPGDRVMTVDGFPGRVTAMNSGPFSGTEDYEVVLDHGMGGGTYTAGQLRTIRDTVATLHEATEVIASLPVEAVTTHTADIDYPELGTILQERQPNENIRLAKLAANKDNEATKPQSSQEDPGQRMDQQDKEDTDQDPETDNNTDVDAAAEPDSDGEEGPPSIEDEKQKNTPDVTPPSACSFCGNADFEDPQMTGRGVRMRCTQCGGTMKSWGGQWEPEAPNSSQNRASAQGDWSQGGAAGVANAPGANFKTTSLDVEAGIVNYLVDKIYDRIEERKDHAILGKEWAWQQQFEGLPHYDNNIAHYCNDCGNVHLPQTPGEGLHAHASLDEYDSEWNFHFVAAWRDVQEKARRIRKEGHVKIIATDNLYVVGEVKGDTATYESQLNYVPGSKHIANWSCGCKWGSYTWGRSPQFKRFEGRLCSHALALQYEASARSMFGKEIYEDTSRPTWQKADQQVVVQYDKGDGLNLTRNSGLFRKEDPYFTLGHEHGREWASHLEEPVTSASSEAVSRIGDLIHTDPKAAGQYLHGFQSGHDDHNGIQQTRMPWFRNSALDTDGIYESPELVDLLHPPIYASVQQMFANDESTLDVIEMLASFNVSREHVKNMLIDAAKKSDEPDEEGKNRDGDEYETPDGDKYNHGGHPTDEEKTQWNDPEYVRANQRDLTDHDDDKFADEHDKKRHRTNDAREHAMHWGWGFPAGTNLATCPQCNGSGCGHCAGQGQVDVDQDVSSLSSADQTDDAGGAISSDGVGASLHYQADYSSADPLAGVDDQNYYSPTDHSHSRNPGSTGWATSVDPGDWGRSVITNNFGLTTDAALSSSGPNMTSIARAEIDSAGDADWKPTSVSGVLLRAHDTGRILMLQRSLENKNDPAAGTWEAPGGHHEINDSTSLHAGIREWQEEVGQPFPEGGSVVHTWRSGPYRGHVVEIPSEDHVDLSQRQIENPDGDHHEQAAWWEPKHAKDNPALRKELKSAPWDQITKAAGREDFSQESQAFWDHGLIDAHGGYYAQTPHHSRPWHRMDDDEKEHNAAYLDGYHDQTGKTATLKEDPDAWGALPSTDGATDDEPSSTWPGQSGGSSGDSSLPHASTDALHTDSGGAHTIDSLHQAFLETPAAQQMMAELGITKAAMKDFSYQEQQDLINEGHGSRARNFSDLKIAGTHYANLPDDEEEWQ